MRDDRCDAVAVDDDVAVMLGFVADGIYEVADMDHGATRRLGERIGEVERHVADDAGFDIDRL